MESRKMNQGIVLAAIMCLVLLLAGCAAPATAANSVTGAQAADSPTTDNAGAPRIFFSNVEDGATIASPYTVTMGSENFAVVPAGEVREGEGHLHIMIDTPCVAVGQGIPKDDVHLHYGQAQLAAELTLAPGAHTLCLQAADGNHIALAGDGMWQLVNVTVE